MRFQSTTLLLFIFLSFFTKAQDMASYNGNWEGEINNSNAFNFKVEVENTGTENAVFRISNSNRNIIITKFNAAKTPNIKVNFDENLSFEGIISKDRKAINGFIKSGLLLYHVKLSSQKENTYFGTWHILMLDKLLLPKLYLSVENGSQDEYQAYPIFADNRFTGTWCDNFQKQNDSITFSDFKTGLNFKGKLDPEKINLGIYLGTHLITEINLKKSETDWEIGKLTSNNKKSYLQLKDLENLIAKDSLPNTHSVLISVNDKLVYEKYFDGYTENIPHDMRSASKSISSAIVGIAKDRALIKSVDQSIFEFLPEKYQSQKDSLKSKIDIKSLLTMSSGLDAIDFGIDRKSFASEDNYQPTKDWTKTILDAPMIYKPNTHSNYGSANPYLLGIVIDSIVPQPLELFMDENLFQKLNISNYIIQTDMNGKPYFGGGMYLKPRDMLKFGELYLKNGKWNSETILSKNWVEKSFKNYHILENTKEKNGYGYLWWHQTYEVNHKSIKSIEARGAGGQYIFVIPELKTVVVITSGNYRNRKTKQPEIIFEKYILPHLLQ